ncbi:DUF3841 domain-containing protein [Paraburkholderia sp. UCT31]|uniref:DUF3841 domain-containing protein n=1 Tax=Paraburkholderia sp. UCT31 TaxID=2615209 RepID=UPI0016553A8E|nr:DUF3841 domain-containing protein [Paraburkholderia sp. UCT31]MBC8740447.1 DUF3841 domain-containing protein [Paraburkholderia sp. UCT31]
MLLHSIQPEPVYDLLCAGKSYRALPFEADYIGRERFAYDWLVEQMDGRCSPRPKGVTYPVWAWHTWWGPQKRKPDLRFASMREWAAGRPQVLLTLEVPDSEVLLSCFDAWHFPLNYSYLGREPDQDAFDVKCAARGLSSIRHHPLPDADLHRELTQSWDAIFNPALMPAMLEFRPDHSCIQATFWELRPEHVKEARWFAAKGATRRLGLPYPNRA